MTLAQFESLTEDELAMALYIVNTLTPVMPYEIPPKGLMWFRKGALESRIQAAFPHVLKEAHPVFSSLLTKLGVAHEIKYEQPPQPVTGSATEPVTGSA